MYRCTGLPPETCLLRFLKSVSSPMLKNAIAKRNVRKLPVIFSIFVVVASPISGRITKEESIDRTANPNMNFGNLYQI